MIANLGRATVSDPPARQAKGGLGKLGPIHTHPPIAQAFLRDGITGQTGIDSTRHVPRISKIRHSDGASIQQIPSGPAVSEPQLEAGCTAAIFSCGLKSRARLATERSTRVCPTQGVLMRSLAKSRRASQLPLFHPPIATPPWESLPEEVRRQTVALLVRLLRARARSDVRADREVRDE